MGSDVTEVLVVMGVAGAGKSTVGRLLARRLDRVFLDADDFHPAANKAKMQAGQPLTEADRDPWLEAIVRELHERAGRGERIVIACSALRANHRARLARAAPARFVHLTGDPALIARRLAARSGHFFDPALLDSQLRTLEPPDDALVVDIQHEPDRVVEEIVARLAPG